MRLPAIEDSRQGASTVEYAVLVTAIAAAIVVIVFTLGLVNQSLFEKSTTCIQNRDTASCT